MSIEKRMNNARVYLGLFISLVLVDVWVIATALMNAAGQMYAIATTERPMKSKRSRTKEVRNEK